MISKIRLSLLLVLVVLILSATLYTTSAQANQFLTTGRIFGSTATVDSEGALIVIGSSSFFSNGRSEAFFFKYAPSGTRLCMKSFGQGEPLDTFGYSVATDASDNIYIVGTTQTFGGEDYDVFVQKYDQSCNLLYQLQWAGPGDDIARGIAVDAADNIYVTGSTTSYGSGQADVFLLKYSSDGSLVFSKIWGGPRNDYGNSVAVDMQGNVYVVGSTSSYGAGQSNIVLLKFDSSGNLTSQQTWGGRQTDYGTGVAVDAAGNVYVAGYTFSWTPGNSRVVLLKYDSSGNLLSDTIWGGSQNDFSSAIATDNVGNVYVTGYTYSYGGTPGVANAMLLKFDPAGTLLYQRTWGGRRGDFGYGIAVDFGGNVYVSGYSYSFGPNNQGANLFILKYDRSGELLSQKTYGGGIPDP